MARTVAEARNGIAAFQAHVAKEEARIDARLDREWNPEGDQKSISVPLHDPPAYIDRKRAHEEILRRYKNAGWIVSLEEFRDADDDDGTLFWDMTLRLP